MIDEENCYEKTKKTKNYVLQTLYIMQYANNINYYLYDGKLWNFMQNWILGF
jgi:hypothetical protein